LVSSRLAGALATFLGALPCGSFSFPTPTSPTTLAGFLPGNHDVGESADNPWMGIPVTSERIAGYTSDWGEDRFFLDGEGTVRSAEPSSPGIVEYLIDGDDVRVELRQVTGLRGVDDAATMTEFAAVMAEIEAG
jgi:hypothetical protein